MVEGVALLTAGRQDGTAATSSLYSGYLFNLAVCNAFGVYIGLERAPIEWVCSCSARIDGTKAITIKAALYSRMPNTL